MEKWLVYLKPYSEHKGIVEMYDNHKEAAAYYQELKKDLDQAKEDLETDGEEKLILAEIEFSYMPKEVKDSEGKTHLEWKEYFSILE